MIVKTSDFTGFYALSQNKFDKDALTEYITTFEKKYLQNLLGCELYDLFIADLDIDGVPQTLIYEKIYDPFCLDGLNDGCYCGEYYNSEGIKAMLKGFIYFHYLSDQRLKNTISGTVTNANENSYKAEVNELITLNYRRFNNSVFTYKAIQKYIQKNIIDYPTYKGVCKEMLFW